MTPLGGVKVYCQVKFLFLLSFGGWYHNLFTDSQQKFILTPIRNIQGLLLVVLSNVTMGCQNQTQTRTSNAVFGKACWVLSFVLKDVTSRFCVRLS